MAWNINELRNPALRDFFGKIFGSASATAAQKVTIEALDATSGISKIEMGTSAVPQVLNTNPGAAVFGETINIRHSAGAGNCDDLIGAYTKVEVIGAGDAGITIVGDAPRAYVGNATDDSVADEAYASQPWVKHTGTGAITAMSGVSAKCDVMADAFAASTVNAIHAHIDGAAAVTGQFDGVMVEVYPAVTSMDSAIAVAIDAGAAVAATIRQSGETTNFIDIAAANASAVVAAGSTLTHDPNAVTSDAYLKVKIGAVVYAIPLYTV